MRVLLTVEIEAELSHLDEKKEERTEALKHLGTHVLGAVPANYAKVEAASIGVITSSERGMPSCAEPIDLLAPASEGEGSGE